MRLSIDGRLRNVRIALGSVAGDARGTSAIGSGGPGTAGFIGAVDEVRWWTRARSPDEISFDRLRKLGGGEAGLGGSWPLDEGKGSVTADISPAGRDGILGLSRLPDPRDPVWGESDSPVRTDDTDYSLIFDPPGPLDLTTGEEFKVRCILRCPRPAVGRLRSWSVSVRHDPRSLAIIDGRVPAESLPEGTGVSFEALQSDEGHGFIARAILDDAAPALLAGGDVIVAEARYRSLSIRGEAQVRGWIRYGEGLPGRDGPGRNSFQEGLRRRLPVEAGDLEVSIRPPQVELSFSSEDRIAVVPGTTFDLDCLLTVAENRGIGPQSWSISVQHDPAILEIIDATTRGTVVETAEEETSVFKITELVGNETGSGFLSAIILGMERPYSLPANGASRIARARYRVREDAPLGATTAISYRDGLQQSGVPIENLVVFISGVNEPRMGTLGLDVVEDAFIRGDFNGDGRLNIADAMKLLSWLFLESSVPDCLDAGDVDDDGRIDIGDPMALLSLLFLQPGRPPSPYPAPGPDPTPDGLGCDR